MSRKFVELGLLSMILLFLLDEPQDTSVNQPIPELQPDSNAGSQLGRKKIGFWLNEGAVKCGSISISEGLRRAKNTCQLQLYFKLAEPYDRFPCSSGQRCN
jgi:hypothetical protein